jgi:hypothetical protein
MDKCEKWPCVQYFGIARVQAFGAIDEYGCFFDFHDFGVLCMQEIFEQSGESQ